MTNKEQELISIILTQRKLMTYLLIELKGERHMLNADGYSALMYLRDFYSVEGVDKYLEQVNNYLEENYGGTEECTLLKNTDW